MKVIMTCGGTGGHIYPAIAIADKIKEKNPDVEIVFIGTGRPLEKRAIPSAGYELRVISATGFHRKRMYRNVKTLKDFLKGFVQAGRIMKEIKPVAVIGTGGYVCVPVITKAHQMGIKTFLHEQNARPGMANRGLESKANKIFLGFEEAMPYFKNKEKIIVTGNPIRKSFSETSKDEARNLLNQKEESFILLIFGGSLGSAMINEVTVEALPFLLAQENISIFFITGSNYYQGILDELTANGLLENPNIKVMEYAQNMDILLASADLVVSRAGALTLGEEALVGIPAILIPSPNVTGNHQYYNAKAVSDKGGAIILEEAELSVSKFVEEIIALRLDSEKLKLMKNNVKKLGSSEAAELIYSHLELGE